MTKIYLLNIYTSFINQKNAKSPIETQVKSKKKKLTKEEIDGQ